MIIARSPLRISLGGGGTDLPSYYERFGGFLVSAAIDKYVYITLHETFVPEFIIKYSKLERVSQAAQIEHPIIREAFQMMGIDGGYLNSRAWRTFPAGPDWAAAGSFTTALLKVFTRIKGIWRPTRRSRRKRATSRSIGSKEPVGKQDQYIAAFGGSLAFNFHKDGRRRSVAGERFPKRRVTISKTIW
jgi:D-glycero-alpha-D-manno-heptose-7-phosphate kinase